MQRLDLFEHDLITKKLLPVHAYQFIKLIYFNLIYSPNFFQEILLICMKRLQEYKSSIFHTYDKLVFQIS